MRRRHLTLHSDKHILGGVGKNKAAVELGSRGGKARAANLSAKRRKAIARKAAKARWSGKRRQAKRS
jgi:hypothetical protein